MNNFQALVLLNMIQSSTGCNLTRLVEAFAEPSLIFEASLNELASKGRFKSETAARIKQYVRIFDPDKEIEEAARAGIKIITILDDYPQALKEIYDYPYVLYVKGDFVPADKNAVAIVGSRGASFYGLSCAREFACALSRYGLTIVSGMARGIDTASHRASIDSGGRTIAVLGSGLDKIYPPENESLFSQISEHGAAISQFSLGTPPLKRNFPARNRIISGLALGVLVVEATRKSGALITARFASEQGREVFAVPGKLSSETSAGTNQLIKDGACMVTEPAEILNGIKHSLSFAKAKEGLLKEELFLSKEDYGSPGSLESRIMRILGDEPKQVDIISQESGFGIPEIMNILLRLELGGFIKQLPGKAFVKTTGSFNN